MKEKLKRTSMQRKYKLFKAGKFLVIGVSTLIAGATIAIGNGTSAKADTNTPSTQVASEAPTQNSAAVFDSATTTSATNTTDTYYTKKTTTTPAENVYTKKATVEPTSTYYTQKAAPAAAQTAQYEAQSPATNENQSVADYVAAPTAATVSNTETTAVDAVPTPTTTDTELSPSAQTATFAAAQAADDSATSLPATEGDNVGQQVPVYTPSDVTTPQFNLTSATQILMPQTSNEERITAIRMDLAIPDPDSNFGVVGGLVKNNRSGFYEFSIDKLNHNSGHVLAFDASGNLLSTQTLTVGQSVNINGLQSVNLVNSAAKIVGGLVILDPIAAALAVGQLGEQAADQFLGFSTTHVVLNADQTGKLYFNIKPVTSASASIAVNGDQVVNFSEPFTMTDEPAPVTVTVYQRRADGTVVRMSSSQLAFVTGEAGNGLADDIQIAGALAGQVRDEYLAAHPGYTLYQDLTITGSGQLIPTTTQYTPGQWVIGSASEYAQTGTMYDGNGGRKEVVASDAVLQQLAGQNGISSIQLANGYSSFDEMGKAGYTFQRVAILGSNGQPVSAPTTYVLGYVPVNYQDQESAWKLVAPAMAGTYATDPQEVEMGKLYFPRKLDWLDAGGTIYAETVRVTGLVSAGDVSGFNFSVIYPENSGSSSASKPTVAAGNGTGVTTATPTTTTTAPSLTDSSVATSATSTSAPSNTAAGTNSTSATAGSTTSQTGSSQATGAVTPSTVNTSANGSQPASTNIVSSVISGIGNFFGNIVNKIASIF